MKWLHKQKLIGYLFILPSVLGVIIFFFIPLVFTTVLAFTDWKGPAGINVSFIGFQNFKQLMKDSLFHKTLINTIIYLLHVPIAVILAFVIAVILNKLVYLKNALRAMFFLPYITSSIAIAFVWMLLFHPSNGPINQFLKLLGVTNPPGWLSATETAMYSINIMSVWFVLGFNIVIFLAALQNVSVELEEAAKIDGAKFWHITRYITFPLVSPITFFLLIMGFISTFKNFGLIHALTGGGPGDSTTVLALYVYQTSFRYYELGYASAIALVLFSIILFVTLIQWYGQKKWVHY
ncbi:carbohydrate ABC transporter permease [Bacillus sp. SD088]|uniref:carbohydrate ABC transporter permease n=1 Tax=Bacillus sp. SD088 TaxID=2782012 RepID=UPI001A970966|nr:sugar ABC transporter permease [Bacillus sp. SD088]MBO0995156.1 sugar ABC transporter permease [Bacillus sp. SD088]